MVYVEMAAVNDLNFCSNCSISYLDDTIDGGTIDLIGNCRRLLRRVELKWIVVSASSRSEMCSSLLPPLLISELNSFFSILICLL